MGYAAVYVPEDSMEEIREKARRLGLSLEEYVLEALFRDLDPPARARGYLEAAEHLLEQAEEELEAGDVRQAAEKVWGAAALAVKAYAEWREGRRLASHRELWEYKSVLEEELGGWVYDAWMAAQGMHACFYEGWCTRRDVEEALRRVRRLVEAVGEVLRRAWG